jgi:hypothetical protein
MSFLNLKKHEMVDINNHSLMSNMIELLIYICYKWFYILIVKSHSMGVCFNFHNNKRQWMRHDL